MQAAQVVDLTSESGTPAPDADVEATLEALVAAVALIAGEGREEALVKSEEDLNPANDEPVVQLAASKVALLVGLHEFGDVCEAILEYVYQNREELLTQDAQTLGLQIVSKDHELQELVDKTGAKLAPQLEEILAWTREQRQPVTQDAAAALLHSVDGLVAQARGKRKLAEEEAQEVKRQLSERIRLSYGCRNEDLALKAYEQQTGSSVRLSNQEYYILDFPRLERPGCVDIDFETIEQAIERRVVAKGRSRRRQREDESNNSEITSADEGNQHSLTVQTHAPYFTICGMIDGVADTLVIDDDDDWQLVPILLEVKNRMRAFRIPPPLYDYIQMSVYLKMLGVTAGDLIQCLHSDRAQIHVTRVSMSEYPLQCKGMAADSSTSHHGGVKGVWASVLLPRLYMIVETIEKLRHNDLLRLAFLNGTEVERRELLRRECDFL